MAFSFLPDLGELARRLTLIVFGVRLEVAAHGGRHRAAVPLVVLTWNRVGRLARRFEALVALLLAGRRPRAVRAPVLRQRVDPERAKRVRLPRRTGWLGQMIWQTRAMGSQLENLLAEPAMLALLEAEPAAGRILRPLCRMLGVAMPAVAGRPEPGAARGLGPELGVGLPLAGKSAWGVSDAAVSLPGMGAPSLRKPPWA